MKNTAFPPSIDDQASWCIHQLFTIQAECKPDAITVTYEDQSLTYDALNAHANQLAYYLTVQGVGRPETLVAICLERSLEMIVGLLGILKAGGAYLPLDPHYPQERLAFMLADVQVPFVLTQDKLNHSLRPLHNPEAACKKSDFRSQLGGKAQFMNYK